MSDALGAALSRPAKRMLADIAGSTDVLTSQPAFTQVFFRGGYGAGFDDFAEGAGTTRSCELMQIRRNYRTRFGA